MCRPSPLNQKHNVVWFLLSRFVDLLRICCLHIISINHSNTVLLINLQKTKKLVQSKLLQQGLFVLISSCHSRQVFCPLLNVYFNVMQIKRWPHLHVSIPSAATFSEEEHTRKTSFYSNK